MTTLKLTMQEESLLVNALRIARDQWKQDALDLRKVNAAARTVNQFERQALEAGSLLDKLEAGTDDENT